MARRTDRQHVSEAARVQELWRLEKQGIVYPSGSYAYFTTDFDERLAIHYGTKGQIRLATYTHWDHDTGEVVSREDITQGKRKRVLHLIGQGH